MKLIVYSVCVGRYDKPAQRIFSEPGVTDYVLFTDDSTNALPPWRAMPMPARDGLIYRRWSRTVKICPHLYLGDHDISVYLDYSFHAYRPFTQFLLESLGNADLAVHRHYYRDCAYAEADRCAELGFERPEPLLAQKLSLLERGFPVNFGLGENGVIIRRNTELTRRFNENWWSEYMAGGQRDQVSFPPAVWLTPGLTYNWIPGTVRDSGYYRPTFHAKDRRVAIGRRRK
jgi:hypothetical protein